MTSTAQDRHLSALLACLLALGCMAIGACGGGANDRGGATPTSSVPASTMDSLSGPLTVFAAVSLTDACKEIAAQFEKVNPGVEVTFNFAGSSALRTQLEQGARADIFASADTVQMNAAKQSGVIEGGDKVFVRNTL